MIAGAAGSGAARGIDPLLTEDAMMKSLRRTAALTAVILGAAALAARAQTPGPVHYRVENTSGYTEGCFDPCLCPIFFTGVPDGSFVLQYTSSDPAGYDHYLVNDVDLVIDFGTFVRHAIGSGQYKRGGAVALLEQLTLDLSIDGGPFEHFDSGLVQPQVPFPRLDVTVSRNNMICYDKVFAIVASPNAAGVGYCFGDGSGTACPCGNAGAAGNGCGSAINGAGANLTGIGKPSLASDVVVLAATGVPNGPGLFFQGTLRTNGGAGAMFGDGLLCVSGAITRLKIAFAANSESRIPGPSDPPLSLLGGIVAPGTFTYQTWYREPSLFCTASTFNLTNGYEIVWSP
jgi:hypothetical protein